VGCIVIIAIRQSESLDDLCEVDMLCSKAVDDRILIRLKAVCVDFQAVTRRCPIKSLCKAHGVLDGTPSNVVRQDELVCLFHSDEAVNVAYAVVVLSAQAMLRFLFAPCESPNLIGDDALDKDILDTLCQQPVASLPYDFKQVEDGPLVGAREPLNRANRATEGESIKPFWGVNTLMPHYPLLIKLDKC
jgi:hypothetical protein